MLTGKKQGKWSYSPSPLDSIRDAVLTVSPNKQYLGIFSPTTPAQTGPVKHQRTFIIGNKKNNPIGLAGRWGVIIKQDGKDTKGN